MLVYYNLLECVPFIQAVGNLLIRYKQQNLDIFKRSFSVSGIAKLTMMQKIETNSFFCLFPKRHADLYKTLRNQLIGGLTIVFCRYAAAGETQIRNHKISNPETTEKNSRSGRQFTLPSCHRSKQPYRIFLQIQRIRKLQTGLLL